MLERIFRPPGTIFKGRQYMHKVIVIQRIPHRRTIPYDGNAPRLADDLYPGFGYHVALPSMVFIIEYVGIGIWPLRLYWAIQMRVYMANAPLKSMDDLVRYCLLPMHDSNGMICMGRTMDFIICPTLGRMVNAVQDAYWSGRWLSLGLARKFEFQGWLVESMDEWAALTKRHKNLAREVNWLGTKEDWVRGRTVTPLAPRLD